MNHCYRGRGAHDEHADQLYGKQREADAHNGIGLAQCDVNQCLSDPRRQHGLRECRR